MMVVAIVLPIVILLLAGNYWFSHPLEKYGLYCLILSAGSLLWLYLVFKYGIRVMDRQKAARNLRPAPARSNN
jgi:hypothetical protein